MRALQGLLLVCCLATTGCGFIDDARVSGRYVDAIGGLDDASLLVTWPVHLPLLLACSTVDQFLCSLTIIPSSFRDSADYLFLSGDGNNVIFERTIFVPKALATPIALVGSYLARWFFPFDDDDRPFEGDGPG